MPRANYDVTLHDSYDVSSFTGDVHLDGPHQVPVARATETSSGVQRRKPQGWIPPTGYQFRYYRIDVQQGMTRQTPDNRIPWLGQKYVGVVGASRFSGEDHFNGAISVSDAQVDNEGLGNLSLIRARNNLKGNSINLGVAFGERNATARLLGDTTIAIAKSFSSLRRGDVRGAMRYLGIRPGAREPRGSSVPKKWLEMQYGWKPLLMDVHGAVDALRKRDSRDWAVTVKGHARSLNSYRYVLPLPAPDFAGANVTARVEKRALTRIDAFPSNEAIISLSSLGITNPALIAWELVPFSFVVDWALPIGDWLNSLDATLGFEVRGCSTSYFVKAEWLDAVSDIWVHSNGLAVQESHFVGKQKLVYLVRTASASVPIPALPSLKDPRSLGHMANGLALLTQVFGRSR